jgi:CRP/FNR family nitrogen fixation transcriptional regulator
MATHFAVSSNPSSAAVKVRTSWMKAQNGNNTDAFGAPGTVRRFRRDSEIFADGDAAEMFFKVMSGVVRSCKFLSDGHRQIEAFHVAGDVFGFELGAEHALSAEAVSDCTLVAYRRRGVESLAQKDEALSYQLFSFVMRSLVHAQGHSLLLGRRSAAGKVASFLIEWAAHSTHEGFICLSMTRQDIADYLGLTIETVSRTLTQFEREYLIELPNTRQVRLRNRDALEDLAA